MSHASHHILRFCVLMPLMAVFPAYAEDTNYTPPPLFGGGAESQIVKKTTPPSPTVPPPPIFITQPASSIVAPIAPPAAAPSEISALIEPVDTSGNVSLEESASVAERVTNPVQTKAPINTNVLLDHPADRIADNAKPLLATIEQDQDINTGIPDLLPYDNTAKAWKDSGNKPIKDLSVPQRKKSRVSMNPEVEKMISEKPQVAIYSRDKKTGKFFKVDNDENNSQTTGKTTFYKARTLANDTAINIQKVKPMPAIPVAGVQNETLQALNDRGLSTITINDLNGDILSVADTSGNQMAAPLPLTGKKMAETEPLAGDATAPTSSLPHVIVAFAPNQIDMNNEQKGRIQDNVLSVLQKNPGQSVEIQAYTAIGTEGVARVSLARGLAVRQYLKDNGIETERMTVRALTAQSAEAAADRVDILFR